MYSAQAQAEPSRCAGRVFCALPAACTHTCGHQYATCGGWGKLQVIGGGVWQAAAEHGMHCVLKQKKTARTLPSATSI